MNDIEALKALIKATDTKRMKAYKKEDLLEYRILSDKYDMLTDQYFEEIRTIKQLNLELNNNRRIA